MAAAGAATVWARPASAAGVLDKIRAKGVLTIGMADDPPWSRLNADGSLVGIVPEQVIAVCKRLGIPKVEAITASFANLIPGLIAGRWDTASGMTITPPRCEQVLFCDPFFRADQKEWVAYLPGTIKESDLPKSFTDMAKQFTTIGLTAGAMVPYMKQAIEANGNKATLVQFPDSTLMIEGLKTKRVQIVSSDEKTMHQAQKDLGGFEIAPVDSGQPNRGSAGAFRKEDADFRDAFAKEQRELRKSGETQKILAKYDFKYEEKFMDISGDDACKL